MSKSSILLGLILVVLASASLGLTPAAAQQSAGDESSEQLLPANPAMWLNSPPLTAETLKGKGVVLWFYEEQCPSCRKKWPDMYAVAKKFEGEPVVFIAVNSGNRATRFAVCQGGRSAVARDRRSHARVREAVARQRDQPAEYPSAGDHSSQRPEDDGQLERIRELGAEGRGGCDLEDRSQDDSRSRSSRRGGWWRWASTPRRRRW